MELKAFMNYCKELGDFYWTHWTPLKGQGSTSPRIGSTGPLPRVAQEGGEAVPPPLAKDEEKKSYSSTSS